MISFETLAHSRLNLTLRLALAGRRSQERLLGGVSLDGVERPIRKTVMGWMLPMLYIWGAGFGIAGIGLFALLDWLRLTAVGFVLGFLVMFILPVCVVVTEGMFAWHSVSRRPLPRDFLKTLPARLFMKLTIISAALTLAAALALIAWGASL
jgi:hypothetical protein